MGRKINIEEVRGFLEASNRQFEQGGYTLNVLCSNVTITGF